MFKDKVPPALTVVVVERFPPEPRARVPPFTQVLPDPDSVPVRERVSARLKVNVPGLVMAGISLLVRPPA